MVDFDFIKECYGCGACANSCPMDVITMKPDSEGFLIPVINKNKCISCGKCDKVCIALSSIQNNKSIMEKKSYLYSNSDAETLKRSASGGAFGILAKTVIEQGGYVCGCVFDENMKAKHIVTNEPKDLLRMHGSKYVQSDISSCYISIKKILKKGLPVLFCGTPCQCAAIQSFARGQKCDNYLYTTAIICHGVPSPMVWNKWKLYLEEKMNSQMVYANHREKGKNYNNPESLYLFKNGKSIRLATYLEDLYCFAFSTDVFLRNSCYNCNFKGDNITADVIIGDFFDFDHSKEYNDGVSSVIINTEKGRSIFEKHFKSVKKVSVASIVEKNQVLIKAVPQNVKRERFFDELGRKDIKKAMKHNIPYVKFLLKYFLNKLKLFEKVRKLKR